MELLNLDFDESFYYNQFLQLRRVPFVKTHPKSSPTFIRPEYRYE